MHPIYNPFVDDTTDFEDEDEVDSILEKQPPVSVKLMIHSSTQVLLGLDYENFETSEEMGELRDLLFDALVEFGEATGAFTEPDLLQKFHEDTTYLREEIAEVVRSTLQDCGPEINPEIRFEVAWEDPFILRIRVLPSIAFNVESLAVH